MDKILSIQTIKNVFAALGAKTSDDNYGVALLDKTTAEPKGLMGISDFASVLGGQLGHSSVNLSKGETGTISTNDLSLVIIKKSDGDNACLILKSWDTFYILGDTDTFVKSDTNGKVYIAASSYSLTVKSNIDGTNNYLYSVVKNA